MPQIAQDALEAGLDRPASLRLAILRMSSDHGVTLGTSHQQRKRPLVLGFRIASEKLRPASVTGYASTRDSVTLHRQHESNDSANKIVNRLQDLDVSSVGSLEKSPFSLIDLARRSGRCRLQQAQVCHRQPFSERKLTKRTSSRSCSVIRHEDLPRRSNAAGESQ